VATSTNVRAGRIFLLLDGVQYAARGSFKVTMGGPKRSAIDAGPNGFQGVSEEEMLGKIEGSITDRGDLSLRQLQQFEGTITVELASGKRYVMVGGSQTNAIELDTQEGEVPVMFEGPALDESVV